MPANDHQDKTNSAPFTDVTGVILAGGRSRRMGRDKASLHIGGETLLDRALRVFSGLFAQRLIAGDRPDLARPDLPAFADTFPGSALGGLHTGLLRAQTPYIFVTACDMPFIDPDLIRILLSRRHHFDVVLPETPAGLEPLFACYSKTCLDVIRQQLETGNFCILDIYPRLNTQMVTTSELPGNWQRALTNINTPEELQQLQKEKSC